MSLFGNILEKLGFGSSKVQAADASAAAATDTATASSPQTIPDVQAQPDHPTAIAVVDVVSRLEDQAASHAEKLNWKVSIVDLLKLLGIDSSLSARKELATELGCPGEKMGDSAQMNMWLHKTVLQKLAENGGNVPKELLN
jgi:hypothetical protein